MQVLKVWSAAALFALAGASASAQTTIPLSGTAQEQMKARATISIMEGVLERAVRQFQEEPMLRVGHLGVAGTESEQRRVNRHRSCLRASRPGASRR